MQAARARRGKPAALWGMLILIASETTLFGCFIGTFFYLRFRTAQWPPAADPSPEVLLPALVAGLLALSSIPMQFASHAVHAGRLGRARLMLVVALLIQCGYFAWEMHDFRDQIARDPISTDAYSSIHYVLLGADHAHVWAGILFNVWLLWKLSKGLTMYRLNATQAITWYWHAVNLVTLAVTATLLSAAV